jgi:hypothetical protein
MGSKLIEEIYVPHTVYYNNLYWIASKYTIYNLFYKNIIKNSFLTPWNHNKLKQLNFNIFKKVYKLIKITVLESKSLLPQSITTLTMNLQTFMMDTLQNL